MHTAKTKRRTNQTSQSTYRLELRKVNNNKHTPCITGKVHEHLPTCECWERTNKEGKYIGAHGLTIIMTYIGQCTGSKLVQVLRDTAAQIFKEIDHQISNGDPNTTIERLAAANTLFTKFGDLAINREHKTVTIHLRNPAHAKLKEYIQTAIEIISNEQESAWKISNGTCPIPDDVRYWLRMLEINRADGEPEPNFRYPLDLRETEKKMIKNIGPTYKEIIPKFVERMLRQQRAIRPRLRDDIKVGDLICFKIMNVPIDYWESTLRREITQEWKRIHHGRRRLQPELYIPDNDNSLRGGVVSLITKKARAHMERDILEMISDMRRDARLWHSMIDSPMSKEEAHMIHNRYQLLENKTATVRGMTTKQECIAAGAYIDSLIGKAGHSKYKCRAANKYNWVIRFDNSKDMKNFIQKWRANRDNKFATLIVQEGRNKRESWYDEAKDYCIHRAKALMSSLIKEDKICSEKFKKQLIEEVEKVAGNSFFRQSVADRIEDKACDFLRPYMIMKQAFRGCNIRQTDWRMRALEGGYWNILYKNEGGGLDEKLGQDGPLTLEIKLKTPDIIIILEHKKGEKKWPMGAFNDKFPIEGYTLMLYHPARPKVKGGDGTSGGAAVWMKDTIKDSFNFGETQNDQYRQEIEITPKTRQDLPSLRILIGYLMPNTSNRATGELRESTATTRERTSQYIQELRERLVEINKWISNKNRFIMIGDFNCWHPSLGGTRTNEQGKELAEVLKDVDMISLNKILAPNESTFRGNRNTEGTYTNHTNETCVDLMIVPRAQAFLWKNLKMSYGDLYTADNKPSKGAHASLHVESQIDRMEITCETSFQWSLDLDPKYREKARTRIATVLKPAANAINQAIEEEISKRNGTTHIPNTGHREEPSITKAAIDIGDMAVWTCYMITALHTYGIRKSSRNSIGHRDSWMHEPDIETLRNEYDDAMANGNDAEARTISKTIAREIKYRLQQKWAEEERLAGRSNMNTHFKRWRERKKRAKVPFPTKMFDLDENLEEPETALVEQYCATMTKKESMKAKTTDRQIKNREKVPAKRGGTKIINAGVIMRALEHLKSGKAPGWDTLPVEFYQHGGQAMLDCVRLRLETFEKYNYIPKHLKYDIKQPLFKKKSNASLSVKRTPNNWRPIALQPAIIKILDYCIKEKLDEHANVIHSNQGGFKSSEGTAEHLYALAEMFHYNKPMYMHFMDMSKAYDMVDRERLWDKLDKNYNMSDNVITMLESMYEDTHSIVKTHTRLSHAQHTTRGLLQGALSSPILFNFYINDLITQLIEDGNLEYGVRINNMLINCLMFADDIVLITRNNEQCRKLTTIVDKWAEENGLEFNPDKCRVLNTEDDVKAYVRLGPRRTKVQHVTCPTNPKMGEKWYKYLGLPITSSGIDADTYLNTIRGRVFGALIPNMVFGDDNHLPLDQRIQLYKATIRSLMEYGMAVIDWKPEHIKALEKLQEIVIRKLTDIPTTVPYRSLILALGVPSMTGRIFQSKLTFYYKLKNKGGDKSISKDIFQEIRKAPMNRKIKRAHTDPIPFAAQVKNILKTLKEKGIHIDRLIESDYTEDLKTHIINAVRKWDVRTTRDILKKQYRKWTPKKNEEHTPHLPDKDTIKPSPLLKALQNSDELSDIIPTRDPLYTPDGLLYNENKIIANILLADNAKQRWNFNECEHCTKYRRFLSLHKLLQCPEPKLVANRKRIFKSICTELNELTRDTRKGKKPHSKADLRMIRKAAEQGRVDAQTELRPMMAFLMGASMMTKKQPPKLKLKMRKMLLTHLQILISATERIRTRDTNWIPIPNVPDKLWEQIPEHPQSSEVYIAAEDLQQGRIICKLRIRPADAQPTGNQKTDGDICITNIRTWMVEAIPHLLSNYNLGLGSAGNRTDAQIQLANEYGKRVIAACKNGGMTFVDGAVYEDTFGGAGILRTDNMNDALDSISAKAFMCPVQSNDAQQTELTAIEKATELMLYDTISPEKREYIFCDCKNAVNFVQNAFARPAKYRKTLQRIRENCLHLRKAGTIVTVHWIPGHVDIDGNERVDLVAKGAARLGSTEDHHFSDRTWEDNGFKHPPNKLRNMKQTDLTEN